MSRFRRGRLRAAGVTIGVVFAACPGLSHACLRAVLDARGVQWSDVIVEAELEAIGQPSPLLGSESHGNTTLPATQPTQPAQNTGPAFQLFTFKVGDVLDGQIDKSRPLRVLRLTSPPAAESNCPVTLRGKKPGEKFILLLRRAAATDLPVTSNAIAAGTRADSMVIVHMMNSGDLDDAALQDLRQLIYDTRQAETGGTEDAVAAQLAALSNAQDDVEAGEAEKALLAFGPRALPAMKKARDDQELSEAGRTRVRIAVEQLAPPALPIEASE